MRKSGRWARWWCAGVVTALLISCGRDDPRADLAAGERELIELRHRLELLEYRLGHRLAAGSFDTLREHERRLEQLASRRAGLTTESHGLRQANGSLLDDFEEVRIAVVVDRRRAAIGRSFDRLVARDGREFEAATVSAVEDLGVSIRHRHGTATLRFDQMTDEQRATFGMDAELARIAEEREQIEALAWHDWVEREAAQAQTGESTPVASRQAPQRPASRTTATTAAAGPLAAPARPFGSRSIYRSYRPRYRTYYYYVPYQPCPRLPVPVRNHPRIEPPVRD